VNPYASTSGAVTFDRWQHAAMVGELVKASGSHLGAVIHPDGEHITIVDDTGHVLSDNEALLALLSLVLSTGEGTRVAVPVSASAVVATMCEQAGVEIVWTKQSTSHLMEVCSRADVVFGASQEGGFIWPAFLPAYDATATLVNLLALLAQTGLKLSKVVNQLPRVHIVHETVVTPWEQKGMVMRTLVERAAPERELVLVDGVKVMHDDGWVLVLPDPEEPVTHVWAEGPNDSDARSLAQEYSRRIRQLLR
jgi:mannose-1-phosphate guanylyltransferase/phosphomannomutase